MSTTDGFDVVVLGAGSGAEAIWGSLGDRTVAVIEPGRVGGECPYLACMPSKAMLRSAYVRRVASQAHLLGATAGPLELGDPAAAFAAAVARRDRVADYRDDRESARELEATGAALLRGRGQVVAPGRVRVTDTRGSDREIGYGELVIATGSSPAWPAITGLEGVPCWTSDEALSSGELPASLVVLGGGPVGCELAQIYRAFGAQVTIIEASQQLLGQEDAWLGAELARVLAGDGIDVRTGVAVESAEPAGRGAVLHLPEGQHVRADRVIVAAGRSPNLGGLGLETLGVEADDGKLTTDASGRVVGAHHLWAAGDVTGVAPFTHTASYLSRLVAANLRGEGRSADYRAIPRVVYTDPPVAAVGLTEASAREQRISVAVDAMETAELARAHADGVESGALHLVADRREGVLVGAAAIGPAADEIVGGELALAIRARIPLDVLAEVVHPFPTYTDGLSPVLARLAGRE